MDRYTKPTLKCFKQDAKNFRRTYEYDKNIEHFLQCENPHYIVASLWLDLSNNCDRCTLSRVNTDQIQEWQDIYKEITFLSDLNHENIISYQGTYVEDLSVWVRLW